MPTIESSKKDLERFVGKQFSKEQLEDSLMFVKGEVASLDGDALKIDVKETNRPDLWSTEGISRELKARLGKEKGIRKYAVSKSNVKVFVDKNLSQIRPLIACAVVEDVTIDNDFIVQMVQLQEKVSEGFGRKRKEAAMGIYDLDVMKPPIHYKGFKDDELEFVPLEWKVKMRPSEILQQHDKGKAYKSLLEGVDVYPIVIDSVGTVASMPPIINSATTGKVTEKTKNLFIEVTGFKWAIIETALEVVCMALADRGGKVRSVEVNFPVGKSYPAKKIFTPEFKTEKLSFKTDLFNRLSGLNVSVPQLKVLLERARYNVKASKDEITVEYPSYRQDILHAVDVVEDALISFGYDKIKPEKISLSVIGQSLKESDFLEKVRDGCIGLSLQEILTFNLSSREAQEKNMLLKDNFVELANPLSENYAIFRKRLAPNLLMFLSKNKDKEFPQRIFEIGSCLALDPKDDNGVKQSSNICVVSSHSNVNFTEIKSILVSLCDYLGLKLEVQKKNFSFLGENSAEITVNGKKGFVGEVCKEVVDSFGLRKPVALFEFEL